MTPINIAVRFTNFLNPFSSTTIEDITIETFATTDCSGEPYSSIKIAPVTFFPKTIPRDNVQIVSSSSVLGESGVTLMFFVTPVFLLSKTGSGKIQIDIPKWYKVGNKDNMMFDETIENSCSSQDFIAISSKASLSQSSLVIEYEGMKKGDGSGQLVFECTGFKNPIVKSRWGDFLFSFYDSEETSNMIQTTVEGVKLDATDFVGA